MENQETKPENLYVHPIQDNTLNGFGGMTLRDHFAGLAMQAYLSSQYNIGKDGEKECSDINICNESYRISDTMLKQRSL